MTRLHASTILSIFTLLMGFFATPVAAQTSSASASPSAELRQVIKDRIEQTMQDRKQPETSSYLGTLGTITKINPATFLLVDSTGRERTIEITPETALVSNDKAIALPDITLNSGAVVMGLAADDVVIQARRVLISSQTFAETREISLGTIEKIEKNTLSLITRNTQETITAPLTRTSVLEDSVGNEIVQKDIRANTSAIIITDLDKDGDRFITRLRLLAPIEASPSTAEDN